MTFETHLSDMKRRPSKLAFWDSWVDGGRQEVVLIRQQIDTPIEQLRHAQTQEGKNSE